MENEEKNEGVTIGEVFRILLKRIWYILGAAVLFTVLVVVLLEFVVNPFRATYSMEFRLVFPTQDGNTYPDGSPFFYQEIVSEDFLTEAKESDPAFAGVNVNKMSRLDHISIEPETRTVNNVTEYTGRYTVSVRGSYFENQDEAEKFIRALAAVPVSRMKQAAAEVDYTFDRTNFDIALCRERLQLLSEKKQTLLDAYDLWIENYSETWGVSITDENGTATTRRLNDLRDSVIAIYGESMQTELESMLEEGGYDYYYLYPSEYIDILQSEYDRNEAEITKYTENFGVGQVSSGTASASMSVRLAGDTKAETEITVSPDPLQRLADLITRNNRIEQWIGLNGKEATLTKENAEKFAARLETEYTKLDSAAKNLNVVVRAVYEKGMSARFDVQSVSSSGLIGIVIGAVGSFLGGLLIACIVTYIVEANRAKRTAKEESEPVEGGEA